MAKLNKGLGKGFGALLSSDFDSSLLMDAEDRIQNVFISDIVPNPEQPRKHFDSEMLNELASSIADHGVLQPLILTRTSGDKFMIIAGERRWRASKIAHLEKVPAIIRDEKELQQLEIAIIENVQRVDLSPLEQAISIEKLHEQFNMSYVEIAKRLGKAVTTLNNIVRLLQLPKSAIEALQSNKITEGHARAILSLITSSEDQEELLNNIIKNGWSVRQAEKFAQTKKQGISSVKSVKKRMAVETPETKRLTKILNARVTINRKAKGGKLEIQFVSDKQLQDIIVRLSN